MIGTDTSGHDHRLAAGVTDDRVFICDGTDVLKVHDLCELADEGLLTPTVHEGRWYAADSPRAWVEAWRADCCGWSELSFGDSLLEQLAAGFEREAQR